MGLTLVEGPSRSDILQMLSVAKMKESLRISYAKEDGLIEDCIVEAYDWLAGEKGWLNRAVISSTYALSMPAFISRIPIPVAPVSSIGSVKYLSGGVLSTVATDVYYLQRLASNGFGTLLLNPEKAWPAPVDANPDAVTVQFSVGMGDGSDVREKAPALVKALKLLAGDYFRNREDTFTDIRVVEIDRTIVNDVEKVAGRYKYYDDFA